MPLFFRPYFLDAVCVNGSWNVHQEQDQFYVYHERKVGPFLFVLNPQLTPYLGWTDSCSRNSPLRFPRMGMKLMGFPATEPSEKYTYRLDTSLGEDVLLKKLSRSHKRYVNKAIQDYTFQPLDFKDFRLSMQQFFEDQGRSVPIPLDLLGSLDPILESRGERIILGGFDAENQLTSVIYLVLDEKYMYLLASGYKKGHRSNYGLTWHTILEAKKRGLIFDFHGSMLPGVERFYAGFGGEKSYMPVHRHVSSWWMEKLIRIMKPSFLR